MGRGVTRCLFVVSLCVCSIQATESSSSVEAENVARAFVDALAANEQVNAYELLGTDLRESLTEAQFVENVKGFGGPLGKLRSIERESDESSPGDECVRVSFLTTFDYSTVRMKLDLCREDSSWRVSYFETRAVTLDLEVTARDLILSAVVPLGLTNPRSFECPDAEGVETGRTFHCRALFDDDCTLNVELTLNDEGLYIVGAETTKGCDPLMK